tara:strand:- start:914 stop:1042 length:129 start_codon:yes stop_codon:yes gene_type:complete
MATNGRGSLERVLRVDAIVPDLDGEEDMIKGVGVGSEGVKYV